MSQNCRLGRRIPLPSTRQIRHELLVMAADDAAKQRAADALGLAGITAQLARQDARIDGVETEGVA
jgi:hypothetical protein